MDCLIDLVFLIVAIIGILTDRQVREKTGGFCAHIWECLKAAAEWVKECIRERKVKEP